MTDIDVDDSLEQREETAYSHTPHRFISESLREQRARSRDAAAAQLVEAFGLEQFDAETIALAAADLSQIREAVRRVRVRRYGAIEIKFIELDVVSWHIVPSPENVRFEESRVRAADQAARYASLEDGAPVLALEVESEAAFISRLDGEVEAIWTTNDHAKSIPFRGIENPGLLSIARMTSEAHGVVGFLDATDGFGRTVGAHKALGISAADAIWRYSDPAADQTLRNELLRLRENPHEEVDDIGLHLTEDDRARLRGSVMLRAQVIVGYSNIQRDGGQTALTFDQVRRKLVGHIHIEPAKPFTLGTQYALKATAAIEALDSSGALPAIPEFSASEIASVYAGTSHVTAATPTELNNSRRAILPDESFALGLAAFRASTGRNDRKARITNAAIRDLTGQTPSRPDRSMLAADLALRLGELTAGTQANDNTFDSRRSALDRAIRPRVFEALQISRESVTDLLALALMELGETRSATTDGERRPHTAELATLALYHLLGRPGRRLLERATRRDTNAPGYISEPNVVVEGLINSEHGLKQLAQVVLDGRHQRQPQRIDARTEPADMILQGAPLLDATGLREIAGHAAETDDVPESPQARLNAQVAQFRAEVRNIADRVEAIESVTIADGDPNSLVNTQGAAVEAEATILQRAVYRMQNWTSIVERQVAAARNEAAQADLDALDSADPS